jgi:putative flippase GtrA
VSFNAFFQKDRGSRGRPSSLSRGHPSAAVVSTDVVRARSLLTRVYTSIDGLYREVITFGAVGAVAFAVDLMVFNLLRTGLLGAEPLLDHKPLTAKSISVLAATVVAWLGNRRWTFRHRQRASRRHEFALFLVMSLVGLAIALACLSFSHYVLGLHSVLADNIAGNVVGLGLGSLFRFWAYRYLVFTTERVMEVKEVPDDYSAVEEVSVRGDGSTAEPTFDVRCSDRTIPNRASRA